MAKAEKSHAGRFQRALDELTKKKWVCGIWKYLSPEGEMLLCWLWWQWIMKCQVDFHLLGWNERIKSIFIQQLLQNELFNTLQQSIDLLMQLIEWDEKDKDHAVEVEAYWKILNTVLSRSKIQYWGKKREYVGSV